MAKEVYVALVEVFPASGCLVLPDDAQGAFARCYAPAKSEAIALVRIINHLRALAMTTREVQSCSMLCASELEAPTASQERIFRETALKRDAVLIGDVMSWTAQQTKPTLPRHMTR